MADHILTDVVNHQEGLAMSALLLDPPAAPAGFADDPIASHSGQFGLARPAGIPAAAGVPSPVGVRPWNLRAAQVMTGIAGGARLSGWHYDHYQQVAVTGDGRRVGEIVAADPTANSVSDLDGDEGKSEDWTYDFCPDRPGPVA
jgi:hypothetical protein